MTMSKAEAYAKAPKPACPTIKLEHFEAFVTSNGELMLKQGEIRLTLRAHQALKLRDWITDTFEP